jgi:hypothetical protein
VAGLRDFMLRGLVTNANTCSTGLLMLMLVSTFAMVHLLFDVDDCNRLKEKANRKKVVAGKRL